MEFTPRAITLFLVAMINLGLAGYLYWRHGRRRLTRLLSVFVLLMGGFAWLMAGMAGARTETFALSWIRAFHFMGYFSTAVFFHFAVIVSKRETRFWKIVIAGIYGFYAVWTILRSGNFLPFGVEYFGASGWFVVDKFYKTVYSGSYAVVLLTALVLMSIQRFRTISSREKKQLNIFISTMVLTIVVAQANQIPSVSFLGAFFPVLFTFGMAWGLTKHRMFDVSVVFRQGAVAASAAAVFALCYVGVILLSKNLWAGQEREANLFAAFAAAMLLTMFYTPVRRALAQLFNKVLGIRVFDPNKKLLDYSLLATRFQGLDDYLQAVTMRLHEEMELERVGVYLSDKVGGWQCAASFPYEANGPQGWPSMNPGDLLAQTLESRRTWLDQEELIEMADELQGQEGLREIADRLRGQGVEAVFPVMHGSRLEGVLMVGPRRTGRPFVEMEYDFLLALAAQTSTMVQNTSLASQVQQADRLSILGTLAASMAHEIRNPLTAISNFVQMLPLKQNDENFMTKFQRIVTEEIQKLSHLTEQLLSFARPGQSRQGAVNLSALAGRVKQLLKYQFGKNGVQLELKMNPDREAWVRADEAELSQVMINLLLNAMQASPTGSVVDFEVVLQKGDEVAVIVRDEGDGMTEEQLSKIFNPFFTTKKNGTGLGLPTCQRVIADHKGKLEVKSIPGEGTEFVFFLPLISDEKNRPSQNKQVAA